jgi:uncharacterized protein (DUF58 family)
MSAGRRAGHGGALVLGGVALASAIVFGSRPLGVVGTGLLLAALTARFWAGFVRQPVSVTQFTEPSHAIEGDDVRLRIEATRASRLPVGALSAHGVISGVGPYEHTLRGRGRTARAEISLGRLPRGRFLVAGTSLEVADPLGFESVSLPIEPPAPLLVHPRLVELTSLFSDAGSVLGDGRRVLLRRPAGFDFHSVREYEQGESLRRVHWPTTARRGQLMVKELEDSPRAAVVVILDCDPAGSAGEPSDSSFDAAVRAAGSVLRAYAVRGKRAILMTTAAEPITVTVASLTGDFDAALGGLAAVQADAPHGLADFLHRLRDPAARSGELVVVTGTLDPAAVDRLVETAAKRFVSVVWIDAPSYAGRPTRAHPGALRLAGSGIAVAVVRRGEGLAGALELQLSEARAHA